MKKLTPEQVLTRDEAADWVVNLSSDNPDEEAFLNWLNKGTQNSVAYIRAESLWANSTQIAKVKPEKTSTSPTKESSFLQQYLTQYKTMGAVFACFLALTFISIKLYLPGKITHQNKILYTAKGEIKSYNLIDGSSVTLNSSSKIYVNLNPDNRIIKLITGEAFFNVKHIKETPFIVKGNGINTKVLGTKFSVKNTQKQESVTVLEGKVSISQTIKHSSQALTLTKNEAATLSKELNKLQPTTVNASDSLAWTKKRLIYRGHLLSDVLSDLNKHYDTPIRLSNPKLGDTKVIAVLSLENQEKTVEKIELILNMISHHDTEKNIIYLNRSLK